MKIKIIKIIKDCGMQSYNGKTSWSKLCELQGVQGQFYVKTYAERFHQQIKEGLEIEAESKGYTKKDGSSATFFQVLKSAFEQKEQIKQTDEKITLDSYLELCRKLYEKAKELNSEKVIELFQLMMNNSNFYIDKKSLNKVKDNLNEVFGNDENAEDKDIPF